MNLQEVLEKYFIEGKLLKIAVLGKRSLNKKFAKEFKFRFFEGHEDGGHGEYKSLKESLKNGSFDLIIYFPKFTDHSRSGSIKKLCKTLEIPFEVITSAIPDSKRKNSKKIYGK